MSKPESKTFRKLANLAEVPSGQAKVFDMDGVRVALCNVEGEVFAVADLCSHDNGPLGEGELVGDQIECPRHGARFDLKSGKPKCLPAVMPIPVYKVEVRNEEIWVEA